MAERPIPGDGMAANLAGMSKNQLYDIMSQMKTLIEQNQQQAREILIQNPLLTKALFQAQIMLGMVQPPQVIPKIQPQPQAQAQVQPQPLAQPSQPPNHQATHSFPGKVSFTDQASASPTQIPVRNQNQSQHGVPISAASVPVTNLQAQSLPLPPLQPPQQPKIHQNVQAAPMSLPQSTQMPPLTPLPRHSASQPPPLQQPQIANATSQLQQPLQTSGIPQMPLQPPLQPPMHPQARTSSMPSFPNQYPPQLGPNVFHPSGSSQHPSQPLYHSASKPMPGPGMGSFAQGQPPLPSQPPPQAVYQGGGSHLGADFNQQGGGPTTMHVDRGSSWIPGLSENPSQLPGPPPVVPGQMGPGSQLSRPGPLSPEMEKALLQQVMSLTPEQINLLPPEQRNQVLQLQQMLRQ